MFKILLLFFYFYMKLPNKVGDNTIESLDLKKNKIKIIENFRGKIKMK